MSKLPFQTVPVHFSTNGSSTQRRQNQRQFELQQLRTTSQAEQRHIRSPQKSKWHMAADIVILQMAIIRQIHPERVEVCWQHIADTIVQRGYLEAGLTAGSVKSRFVSLIHSSMLPHELKIPKLYDRIAIFFHDEPIPEHKKPVASDVCQPDRTSDPAEPTDCAESQLRHKKTALQVIDRASLAAHCDEALGIRQTQRPDIVAQKRHSESLRSQKSQLTQNSSEFQAPQTRLRTGAQLPTPAATPELSQITASQQSADLEAVPAPHGQKVEDDEPCDQRSSKMSRSSQKHARPSYSVGCFQTTKRVKVQPKSEEVEVTQKVQDNMRAVLRAEITATATRHKEQARKHEKRKFRLAPSSSSVVEFTTVKYKHSKQKQEKCYVLRRTDDGLAHASKIKTTCEVKKGKGKRKLKTRQNGFAASHNPRHGIRHSNKFSRRLGIHKSKKTTKLQTRLKKVVGPQFLSSPSGSDEERPKVRSRPKPSESRRLQELVKRLSGNNVTSTPAVNVITVESLGKSKPKRDVVGDVYNNVLKSRLEKVAIVAARASAVGLGHSVK